MLFSFYASFRWAKGKHYTPKMTVLIVLASLLSAVFAYPTFGTLEVFLGPASILTFPFYSDASYPDAPPPLRYYEIHFLSVVIYPTQSLRLNVSPFHFALLLFLLVNTLSAGLGYWLVKKNILVEGYGWRRFLLLVALGIVMIWISVLLYRDPTWSNAWRFGSFGFTWIVIVAMDFIQHKIG